MDYYQKYLKYKNKYLNLKKIQKGGACFPDPNPNDVDPYSWFEYSTYLNNNNDFYLYNINGRCIDIYYAAGDIRLARLPPNTSYFDVWEIIKNYNDFHNAKSNYFRERNSSIRPKFNFSENDKDFIETSLRAAGGNEANINVDVKNRIDTIRLSSNIPPPVLLRPVGIFQNNS